MNKKTGMKVAAAAFGTVLLGSVYLFTGGSSSQDELIRNSSGDERISLETDAKFSGNFDDSVESADRSYGEEDSDVQETEKRIIVYVSGAVHEPGVVELPSDARIYEAVLAAGGMTEEADTNALNLAGNVKDGDHIHVPKTGENPTSYGNPTKETGNDGLVNLNTATQAELERLSGIGPSKAAAIIAYREEHGRFQKITDLMKVPGIGEKLFETIKNKIKV